LNFAARGLRPLVIGVLICAWLLCAFHAEALAQVIDRVVAVVGGQAITASDVRAARRLGLVTPADLTEPELVDRLVMREMMRTEVDRFAVAPPDAAEVDAAVAAARARLGADAPAALDALGMSHVRLRAWIEDDRRIVRYLDQRFDAAAQPADEEILTFFRSREREFARDGRPQPFESVQAEVRARLMAERRQQLIDEWVAGLRRRTTVTLVSAGS
jgi:hypothetical protein